MTLNDQNNRCRAVSTASHEQCKHRRLFRSRYCWHHQSWGAIWISVVLSLILGFALNVVSNRYTERAPELSAYLNSQLLAEDTVLVYPTNTVPTEFRFSVKNQGDMAANDLFVFLHTHSYCTNLGYGSKWLLEPLDTNSPLVRLIQRSPISIPPNFEGIFQPMWIDPNKVEIFSGFLSYGSTGAKTKKGRIHISFQNPTGVTNVLYDKAARDYIRKLDPAVAKDLNISTLKLLFDSTNQALKSKRATSNDTPVNAN